MNLNCKNSALLAAMLITLQTIFCPVTATSTSSILAHGRTLDENDFIQSSNGLYIVVMQPDGNLVGYLYPSMYVFWAADTNDITSAPYTLVMQTDDNLVIYGNGTDIWSTDTKDKGNHTAYLKIMDNRNIVVINNITNEIIWESETTYKETTLQPSISPNSQTKTFERTIGWYSNWTSTIVPQNETAKQTNTSQSSGSGNIETSRTNSSSSSSASEANDIGHGSKTLETIVEDLEEFSIYFVCFLCICCVFLIVASCVYENYYSNPIVPINAENGQNEIVNTNSNDLNIFLPHKMQHFIFVRVFVTLYDIFADFAYGVYLLYVLSVHSGKNDSKFSFLVSIVVFYILFWVLFVVNNGLIITKMFAKEFGTRNYHLFSNFCKCDNESILTAKNGNGPNNSNSDSNQMQLNALRKRKESKANREFKAWFKKHGARSGLVATIYTLSVFNVELIELLTSKVFNLQVFSAPFQFETIYYLKTSIIISIFIENLPQILVQLIVRVNTSDDGTQESKFTFLNLSFLFVSIFEIVQMIMTALVWKLAHVSGQSQDMDSRTQTKPSSNVDNSYVKL